MLKFKYLLVVSTPRYAAPLPSILARPSVFASAADLKLTNPLVGSGPEKKLNWSMNVDPAYRWSCVYRYSEVGAPRVGAAVVEVLKTAAARAALR